jgi:hypothetical protein
MKEVVAPAAKLGGQIVKGVKPFDATKAAKAMNEINGVPDKYVKLLPKGTAHGDAGAKYPRLTLFNLPPDGRVEFHVPDPKKPEEAKKDWSSAPIHETFKVDKPPYGAEHMVAIFSENDLSGLHAALAAMTTSEHAEALRASA